MSMAPAYPFSLDVDPPAPQSRLSVLLRIIFLIPQIIVVGLLGVVTGIITLIAWVLILITGAYPAGMASFVINWLHWATRVNGYAMLLTDKYPPFSMGEDPAYPVRTGATAQIEGRSRLTVFFRMLMAIPHLIILYFLQIAAQVVLLISWFIALFTGSVPPGLHTFLVGYQRWNLRATAYYLLLTDEYPPFNLN
jgi:hypothetical protein